MISLFLILLKELLKEINMSAVNQIMAQIKICEMWKANHIDNYPIKVETLQRNDESRVTRALTNNVLKESAKSNVTMSTFINDAIKAWNKCTDNIKEAKYYNAAKI